MGNFFKKGEGDTVIGYMVQRNVYTKNHIYENFGGYVVTADIKDWIGLIPPFTNQEHYYEVSVNVSDIIRHDPKFILTNKITVIRELDIESRQKKASAKKLLLLNRI